MKLFRLPLIVLCLGLTIGLCSCDKDMDMNQEESVAPTPLLESDLMTSSLEANDFLKTNKSQDFEMLTDTLNIKQIRSDYYMDELKKINLSLNFINTLEVDFNVDFEFLNEANELKYKVHIPINSASIEKPVSIETMATIKDSELNIFKEATKLVYKISLSKDSKPMLPNAMGNIAMQSKASFLFNMSKR